MIDTRLVFYAVWGLGVFALGPVDLAYRWLEYVDFRDPRSRRDLLESFALWLVAALSSLAIALVFFGTSGTGLRGFVVTLALGAFLGVEIIKVTDRPHRKRKQ